MSDRFFPIAVESPLDLECTLGFTIGVCLIYKQHAKKIGR